MKRLVQASQYGKQLYKILGGKDELATIFYDIDNNTFFLIIGEDVDSPTETYKSYGDTYPSLVAGLEDMVDTAHALIGSYGFTHNRKLYDEAVQYLIGIEDKVYKKRKKKQQDKVAPTSEDFYTGEEEKKLKKEKDIKIKTIEFHFSENEKAAIQGQLDIFATKNYIHSYGLFPKAPEPEPAQAKHSRLRKIIAYSFYNVLGEISSSGTIRDFQDQLSNVVSAYYTNVDDVDIGKSCEGFIINYNSQFISFNTKAEQELENIRISGANGQGGILYSFQEFVNDLDSLTSQFNITGIKKFGDFGQAEAFILESNNNIQKKISFNEMIAGPNEKYNQEEEKEDEQREQPSVPLYTARIHYNANDREAVQALRNWIKELYDYIKPYNPNLKID